LLAREFIGGYDLGIDYPELAGHVLLAVTENRTRAEIDEFVTNMEGLV
jgi:glycine dehydrogenase subunit 1